LETIESDAVIQRKEEMKAIKLTKIVIRPAGREEEVGVCA
jgi:hypothetical protein